MAAKKKPAKKPAVKRISSQQDIEVTRKQIAYIFGVTLAALKNWQLEPIGKRGGTHVFSLREVITDKFNRQERTRGSDLNEQRSRITSIKAEKAEIELMTMQGELLFKDIALDLWKDTITAIRAKLLTIPAKVAQALSIEKSAQKVEKRIAEEIRQALIDLKEYEPGEYSIKAYRK